MMLRKSHSTEWQPHSQAEKFSESTVHSLALQQHFSELKQELDEFNAVFAAWAGTRRQALTSDKEAYLKTLAEEQDLVEQLKRQLASLVTRRQQVVAELQAEQKEFEEGSKYNRELESQRTVLSKRLHEIKEQVDKLRDRLGQEEAVLARKEESARQLALREGLNNTLCQEKLGLYVESQPDDSTKFSFKYIDASDWERRFAIVVDVSTGRYQVRACEPHVAQLPALLEQLQADGDFYGFLRKIRAAFVDIAK